MKKKISIYVENARLTPSSYYRLTQYFQSAEVRLQSVLPDRIYRWWHSLGESGRRVFSVPLYVWYVFRTLLFLLTDYLTLKDGTVILARAIVPRRLPFLHKYLIRQLAKCNKIIWDFDDNILANRRISQSDFCFYSKYSDIIVVTSDILKSLIAPSYANKVKILPTTDGDMLGYDIETLLAQRRSLYDTEVRLIWVATATGLDFIRPIIPSLDRTAKRLKEVSGKKLSLHVVCNKPLLSETSHLELINIPWERKVAMEEITHSHIGLMPLPDTEFTRGKGGFKLIQYMSTAMPVVASAVGVNRQIVTEDIGLLIEDKDEEYDDWGKAILEISSDWEGYVKRSRNARKHYDRFFSYDTNKAFWSDITTVKAYE